MIGLVWIAAGMLWAQGAADVEMGNRLREKGDLAGAIRLLEGLVERRDVVEDGALQGRALSYLGFAYVAHGDLQRGIAMMDRAIALYERLGDLAKVEREKQLKAMLLARQGKGNAAASAVSGEGVLLAHSLIRKGEYRRAVEMMETVLSGDRARVPPALHWMLSEAYFHLGRYGDAERAAADGMERMARLGNGGNRLLSYVWRVRALDKLGRTGDAGKMALEGIRLHDRMRGNLIPEDGWKRAYGEARERWAHDAIDVMWRGGMKQEALEVAERARARAFLDLMASKGARVVGVVEDGDELRLKSAAVAPVDGFEQMVARVKLAAKPVVAYWVHPNGVYLWLMDGKGVVTPVFSGVAREHLEKLVERARAFRTKVDREAWRELYDLLIQPVRRYLPYTGGAELTVVPHGALLDLPFAALLDKRGRYLAEDFSLRIAPSMGYAGVDGGKREGRYLLVGAPVRPATDAQGRRLAALPGASIELEKIGRITRTKTVLRGGEAMGGRVREALAEAKVVHFATHAVVDDKRPFDSFLALSEGEKLTAREVYGMELKADLVVLSACRSGSGKVTSDGLLGFTRAFLYAGAGAVIAPLWDIADEPTARLMDEFYRQYGAGVAKSAALRMAQLKLIGDLRSGRVVVDTVIGPVALGEHPALWAGFVVQGGN